MGREKEVGVAAPEAAWAERSRLLPLAWSVIMQTTE